MSRIGFKSITMPAGVTLDQDDARIIVKGPKGELSAALSQGIVVKVAGDKIEVTRRDNLQQTKAFHGLMRSLINNMVIGVSQGYSKKMEMIGTGYRAKKDGQKLVLSVGFSHPVEIVPPAGIEFTTEGDTVILVSGIDKQSVGQVASNIRSIRPPEPYKGKGIRYQGEIVRRKAGKAAKVGSAA